MALFKTPEYTLIGSKALEEAKPYTKKMRKKSFDCDRKTCRFVRHDGRVEKSTGGNRNCLFCF